jgi:PAS domain S-box-containing protein
MDPPSIVLVTRPRRYLVALAATAAAAAVRYGLAITLEPKPPLFVLFLGAVGVAAWFGGIWPGLLSTALGCVLGLFFIEPQFRLAIESTHDLLDTGIFAVIGVAISWLCGRLHAARTEAEIWSRELLQVSAAERAWKDRYEAAVNASGHVLYDLDCVAGSVTFSGACEQILGYSCTELDGDLTRWRALLHPADRSTYDHILPARQTAGGLLEIEYRVRHRGGYDLTIHDVGQPIRGASGEVTHVVGFLKDISDRKRAEEALRAADRRKDDFIATLAHELRNPLAPIRHAVALLHALPDMDPQSMRHVAVIARQVASMARLLDDLLDMSRITSGKLELRRARVDLAEIVDVAVETARPTIEAKRHTLELVAPRATTHVDADFSRLAQVVANLLVNAAKYTERGGQIRVCVARQGNDVTISVRDSGIGIASEHLARIFEMFSQVSSALDRSEGGLGVGLALSRGLVEMHGGTIEAHSAGPSRGCEFIVRLPLAETPPPEPRRDEPQVRPSPLDCRILVADDNVDNADTLAMLLALHGGDVRVAHDGAEAVAVAHEFRPQIAILDIGMPGMNGYAVCQRIRAEPWGSEVALIAQTGWAQEEDRRRSREAGFDLHVTKPVDPAELLRLLAGLRHGPAGVIPESS